MRVTMVTTNLRSLNIEKFEFARVRAEQEMPPGWLKTQLHVTVGVNETRYP